MTTKKKHDLEYFQKDPWPVRVFVLAMKHAYSLALAVLLSTSIAKLPSLISLLKSIS